MNRVKIVNDPSDLVPLMLAVDSPLKREIMREITESWKSMKEIEDKCGPEGKDIIIMFEKSKIVESKWQPAGFKPEKVYHTYYNSIHINIQTPITEMSDVLSVAVMPDKEFKKLDEGNGKYMVTHMQALNHSNNRSSEMVMEQVAVTAANKNYFTVAYLEKE